MIKKSILAEICITLVLLLFSYTASSKLLDYSKFVFQMSLAPVPFMKTLAPWLGWLVPMSEAMVVIGLLFDKLRLIALYSAVYLLLVFEIYILLMLNSGLKLPCTCGGIISQMSWTTHLLFNAAFIIITIIPIVDIQKNKAISN